MRKVFGGNAGMWMRRRKQTTLRLSPGSEEGSKTQDVTKNIAEDDPSRRLSTFSWDDSRCRPVYDSGETGSATESDDESVDTVQLLDSSTSPFHSEPAVVKDESQLSVRSRISSELSNSSKEIAIEKSRVIAKRSFASAMRLRPTEPSSFFIKNQPALKKVRGDTLVSSDDQERQFKPESKDEKENGIISTSFSGVSRLRSAKPFIRTRRSRLRHENIESQGGSINLDFDANKEFPKAPKQLSSVTSIDAMQKFFTNLDAEQNTLSLEASLGSPKVRSRCVRTQRRLDRNDPSALDDYNKYVKVCRDTGICPISIQLFLENRRTFTSDGSLYNSFLDE